MKPQAVRTLGVIPARGGSTRIPRKNLEYVGPWPLWRHAANAMSRTDIDWVVSTDDAQTAIEVCQWYGVSRLHARYKVGDGPMSDVLLEVRDALPTFDPISEPWADVMVCVQPTSPFVTNIDIIACLRILEASTETQSVVSVDESTGLRNGAIYITRVSMLRDGLVFDEHSLKYPMPHDRSIDINTPEDLERARELWSKLHS